MVGWCLISLVTSSNYQLEAGDREARYVMLGNIASEWSGREAGSKAAQWNHWNSKSGLHYNIMGFVTASLSIQCFYYCLSASNKRLLAP